MNTSINGNKPLEGRVAVVTGAGKGLGAAFARSLAQHGAAVVVNNRIRPGTADEAAAVAESIRASGGRAIAEHSDVTDPEAGARMVKAAIGAFGHLDTLVLNAGTAGQAVRFSGATLDEIRQVMETNFFANTAIVAASLEALAATGSGRVLFISSSAGLYGVKGRAHYAASKGALNAFAFTLADEWRGKGITFNVLCPYAATRMTGADDPDNPDALLVPDRIAPAASWLVSPHHDRTGEVWIGGGGWLRRVETVETGGAAMPQQIVDFETFAVGQSGLETARGFSGAEAAFADLFGDLRAHLKGRSQ